MARKPMTRWGDPDEQFLTHHGLVTYRQWCELEAQRIVESDFRRWCANQLDDFKRKHAPRVVKKGKQVALSTRNDWRGSGGTI